MTLPTVSGEFRIGMEPNLRFSPSGVAVCKLRVVASSNKKQEDGTWIEDKTIWLDLVGFKGQAENMAESFEKGDLVMVSGKLQTDEWTDSDNNKRTSISVLVDNIGPSVKWNAARTIKSEHGASRTTAAVAQNDPANDPWATGAASTTPPPF